MIILSNYLLIYVFKLFFLSKYRVITDPKTTYHNLSEKLYFKSSVQSFL